MFSTIIKILSSIIGLIISIGHKDFANTARQFIDLHYFFFSGILILIGISFYDSNIATIGTFPEAWNLSIQEEIGNGVKSLTVNPTFISITKAIRSTVVIYLLRPLDMYLTYLPYWYTMAALVIIDLGLVRLSNSS